jgi:hypothetical protein
MWDRRARLVGEVLLRIHRTLRARSHPDAEELTAVAESHGTTSRKHGKQCA